METFRKKQPANYNEPYQNVLIDIDQSISRFTSIRNIQPNYILINTSDYEHLVTAFRAAGAIPKDSDLTIIHSARVIRTTDIAQGMYDVVRN